MAYQFSASDVRCGLFEKVSKGEVEKLEMKDALFRTEDTVIEAFSRRPWGNHFAQMKLRTA